jgi:hypothetical protein
MGWLHGDLQEGIMTLGKVSGLVAFCVFMAASAAAQAAYCTAPHSIKRVKNTYPVGHYEYVVFDIVASPNRPYSVSTGKRPFIADPSGLPVSVKGAKFKKIRFADVFWTCSIRHALALPKTAIKDVKRLGQFEGVVEYVVGYRKASRYISTYAYPAGSNWKVVMKFEK